MGIGNKICSSAVPGLAERITEYFSRRVCLWQFVHSRATLLQCVNHGSRAPHGPEYYTPPQRRLTWCALAERQRKTPSRTATRRERIYHQTCFQMSHKLPFHEQCWQVR